MPGAVRGAFARSRRPPHVGANLPLFPSIPSSGGWGAPSDPHVRARLPVDVLVSALPALRVRQSGGTALAGGSSVVFYSQEKKI